MGAPSPIVLLHGFALDARMWRPQVDGLGSSHRVIALDLPGFGPLPAPFGGRSLARAVVDRCDDLGVTQAHVVGLSLGGAVAVDLALAFPERLRSLTLVDAALRRRPSGIAAWDRCVELTRAGRLAEATEAWLADPLFDGARRRPDVFRWLREMAQDYSGAHWAGHAQIDFEAEDPAARLAEIDLPTLVVVGSDDLASFRAISDEYATKLPRARKLVLAEAGHLSSMEAPAEFNAALAVFVDSAEGGDPKAGR